MSGWIAFWTWVYIISCAAGALMFLMILPFGVRDLVRLYRFLNTEAPPDSPPCQGRAGGGSAGSPSYQGGAEADQ